MKYIHTENAPNPAGHYSQAVIQNNLVFVSGQLAINPITKERELGPIEKQTELALKNMKAILEASGCELTDVVKTTVFITDISLWDAVNKVYVNFFGDHKPARSIIPTRDLHHGFKIEIEAIAIKK